MKRESMELCVTLRNGDEIPIYKGNALNHKRQCSRIAVALGKANVNPCRIVVTCFRYSADYGKRIYAGEISAREMRWTGAYCKSLKQA